jgi:hypothetical protein
LITSNSLDSEDERPQRLPTFVLDYFEVRVLVPQLPLQRKANLGCGVNSPHQRDKFATTLQKSLENRHGYLGQVSGAFDNVT